MWTTKIVFQSQACGPRDEPRHCQSPPTPHVHTPDADHHGKPRSDAPSGSAAGYRRCGCRSLGGPNNGPIRIPTLATRIAKREKHPNWRAFEAAKVSALKLIGLMIRSGMILRINRSGNWDVRPQWNLSHGKLASISTRPRGYRGRAVSHRERWSQYPRVCASWGWYGSSTMM